MKTTAQPNATLLVCALALWLFVLVALLAQAGETNAVNNAVSYGDRITNVSASYLGYVFSWGLIGLLVGWLAGERRGDRYTGAALGVLLGPIGWLITLCGDDKREKCPECGGVLAPGARRCMHCGSVVRLSSEEVKEKYGVQVKCPACGELGFARGIEEGTRIECPVCRRTFDGAKAMV